jgi:hypothetical protein
MDAREVAAVRVTPLVPWVKVISVVFKSGAKQRAVVVATSRMVRLLFAKFEAQVHAHALHSAQVHAHALHSAQAPALLAAQAQAQALPPASSPVALASHTDEPAEPCAAPSVPWPVQPESPAAWRRRITPPLPADVRALLVAPHPPRADPAAVTPEALRQVAEFLWFVKENLDYHLVWPEREYKLPPLGGPAVLSLHVHECGGMAEAPRLLAALAPTHRARLVQWYVQRAPLATWRFGRTTPPPAEILEAALEPVLHAIEWVRHEERRHLWGYDNFLDGAHAPHHLATSQDAVLRCMVAAYRDAHGGAARRLP